MGISSELFVTQLEDRGRADRHQQHQDSRCAAKNANDEISYMHDSLTSSFLVSFSEPSHPAVGKTMV